MLTVLGLWRKGFNSCVMPASYLSEALIAEKLSMTSATQGIVSGGYMGIVWGLYQDYLGFIWDSWGLHRISFQQQA